MSRLLNEDDVVKIIDEHTDNNGALDNDITCILEDVPSQMSAVEVLEWLVKHYSRRGYKEAFGSEYDLEELLIYTEYSLKPQEIVDRIEKYEAEKKTEINRGLTEQKFKVGDWVRTKDNSGTYKIVATTCDGKIPVIAYPGGSDNYIQLNTEFWEHAEPPQEEKQTRADKFKELIKGTEFENAFMCRSFNANFPETMKSWRDKDYWMEEVEKDISEEKQKIEKISPILNENNANTKADEIINKINELVDAVNELGGTKFRTYP